MHPHGLAAANRPKPPFAHQSGMPATSYEPDVRDLALPTTGSHRQRMRSLDPFQPLSKCHHTGCFQSTTAVCPVITAHASLMACCASRPSRDLLPREQRPDLVCAFCLPCFLILKSRFLLPLTNESKKCRPMRHWLSTADFEVAFDDPSAQKSEKR